MIPTDLILGLISGIAPLTSNRFCVSLSPVSLSSEVNLRHSKKSKVLIIFRINIAFASALSLEAEVIKILRSGFFHSNQTA